MAKRIALYATCLLAGTAAAQPYTMWKDYAGSADAAQYSALKQIGRGNIGKLELAWFYPTPGRAAPSTRSWWTASCTFSDRAARSWRSMRQPASRSGRTRSTARRRARHQLLGEPDRAERRLIFSANSYLQEIDARPGHRSTRSARTAASICARASTATRRASATSRAGTPAAFSRT